MSSLLVKAKAERDGAEIQIFALARLGVAEDEIDRREIAERQVDVVAHEAGEVRPARREGDAGAGTTARPSGRW